MGWLDHRRSEEILIALTGGEIVWDAQLGDFDRRATTALPTILKGAFKSERSATSVASFAAAITGQSLPDVVGEDVRQHRRIRRLALVMVLLFFSLSRCSFLFTRCFRLKSRVAQALGVFLVAYRCCEIPFAPGRGSLCDGLLTPTMGEREPAEMTCFLERY